MAGIVAVGAAIGTLRVLYAGEALPGTRVAGISVSGANGAEMRKRLASWARFNDPVLVDVGAQRLSVRPSVAGYRVDLNATVARALRAGRDGVLGGAGTTLTGVFGGRDVSPVVDLDEQRLERVVVDLARRIDRPSSVGALEASGQTLEVAITPPHPGRAIDRDVLAERLRTALLHGGPRTIQAPIVRRRVVSLAAVRQIAAVARTYLRQPVTLSGVDGPLTVAPRQLAGLLALEPLSGGRAARLGVDQDRVDALVERLAASRDSSPRSALITAPARSVTVDGKGDLSWRPHSVDVDVRAARSGREVMRREAATTIARAVRATDHTAELPVRRVEPQISTAQARAVDQLIGTFTSNYEPGQPRVTNIRQIARAVDGTVVAPGGRFSLNAAAGERTEEKGYVEAPFIADGKIVPSVGGGVSQFSTTLYNAAYFAGLRIDAHRPQPVHRSLSGRSGGHAQLSRHRPGVDQRHHGTRPHPRVNGPDVGHRQPVRQQRRAHVDARTGARRPIDGGNFDITVTRIVRYPDGRAKREPFTTRYDRPAEDE